MSQTVLRNRICSAVVTGVVVILTSFMVTQVCGEEAHSEESALPVTAIPQIHSRIGNVPVVIDGNDNEWISNRTVVVNEFTAAGVLRDQDYLYVHFITSDTEFSMQIMIFGMTVWIDPQGSQNKMIGVQFPVLSMQPPPPRDKKPPMGEELHKLLDERLKDLNIVNTHKRDIKVMTAEWAKHFGIEAEISITGGYLCYELKYPLLQSGDDILNMDLRSEKQIDICFETPEIDFHRIMRKYGKLQNNEETRGLNSQGKDPTTAGHSDGMQPGFPLDGRTGGGIGRGRGRQPSGTGDRPADPPGNLTPSPPEGPGGGPVPDESDQKQIGEAPHVNRIHQWIKVYFQY